MDNKEKPTPFLKRMADAEKEIAQLKEVVSLLKSQLETVKKVLKR